MEESRGKVLYHLHRDSFLGLSSILNIMLATIYLLKLMLMKDLITDCHVHFHVQVFKAPRKMQMIKSVQNRRKVRL